MFILMNIMLAMLCKLEHAKTLKYNYLYRSLRDQWEVVCDQLSDTQRKLESCLIQWSSYDENYEQLQKWLLDTEVQLKEDTDMKGTLPDKKAQLQNHRVLHQDIMSRQHVVDNLTEKAQTLSQSSPVAKVNKFVDESHTKYDKLCGQSKQMLDKLEVSDVYSKNVLKFPTCVAYQSPRQTV